MAEAPATRASETTHRSARPRSPGSRVVALLALCVALAAQPQVICGLHCIFSPADPGSMPMSHGAPVPMAFCHSGAVTSHRTPIAPRLALAWLPTPESSLRPLPPREDLIQGAWPMPGTVDLVKGRPPPRA